MPESARSSCPRCGAHATGRYCAACGHALAMPACRHCRADLAPGSRFCGQCGAAAGSAPPGPVPASVKPLVPWALAALVAVVALVVVLAPGQSPPAGASAAGAVSAAVPLPDLSALPPRARFDTLYNRVMRGSEQGDEANVMVWAPMALAAYGDLADVDADARYHAAMIRLHTGDAAGAAALADTITALQPSHLFGFVLRGTVARFGRDDAGLAREQAALLRVWDAEMAAARPEYGDHQFILNQFVTEARARTGQ